jgi:hypothetical protein
MAIVIQPLRWFIHRGPAAVRIELAGSVAAPDISRLTLDAEPAFAHVGGGTIIADLSFVKGADESGLDLLRRWAARGVQFVARVGAGRLLAELIVGHPVPEDLASRDSTWQPWFGWSGRILG